MRDQMKDVRSLIVGMMESLGDGDDLKGNKKTPEEIALLIQRGDVMARLSREYVESVKTEVLAIRNADLHGYIPACMETPKNALAIIRDNADEKSRATELEYHNVSRIGGR